MPSDGRSTSKRSAENVDGEATVAEREYRDYATSSLAETGQDPDVLIDVPVVKVDKIHLKVADLEAHVALNAQVLDLVQLDVGVDVHLGELEVDIEGVEAQALLKVRLDHVGAIVDRVLTTIDRNPELVRSLGAAIEDVGGGAGELAGKTGDALEQVGQGARQAVPEIGKGAGEAVGGVGKGVGQAAGALGGADAKEAAKMAAAAATEEAKDLGRAATRKATEKVQELSERRLRKRADKHHATEPAMRLASELNVDLDEIDGSGAEGRITVRDVKHAAAEQ